MFVPAQDDQPPVPPSALCYDTPLAVGQVRVDRPDDGQVVIAVGPPPLSQQIVGLTPVALLFGVLCVALGLLMVGVVFRPGAIPYDKLLLIPTLLALGFAAVELVAAVRSGSLPCRLSVDQSTFRFPYPSERSAIEEIPSRLVGRINVVTIRTRLLRRRVNALEIELQRGPRFRLFIGYPQKTLDELTDLLGPALGLSAAE